MNKSKTFVLVCVGFSAGILLGSKFYIPPPHIYIAAAVFICAFAILSFNEGTLKFTTRVIMLFLICASLGILRIELAGKENQFAQNLDTKQSIEAIIVKDVDVRENFQMLTVRPDGATQNILVATLKTNKYFYGDRIWLTGKITEAKEFNDFDYKGYLERQNVYALMKYPQAVVLKKHQGNIFIENLIKIKYLFIAQVNKVLEEPYASLLLGILIGAKKALPSEIIDQFNKTGTSHIIAISGYNISVIVGALGFLSFYLGRKSSFVFTLGIIFVFVIISGASASVIRAAVMGGLLLLSSRVGRLYAITPALCFAAVTMLVINPKILFWDPGFQLSFLATAGIVYGLPLLQQVTYKVPKFFGIKMLFLTTMSAIIATLPLLILDFGQLSLAAPLVNILVLPAVPPAMFFGFFSALPFFGAGFAFIAHVLLWYILLVIKIFAGLKYAAVGAKLALWQFYVLYGIIIASYFILKTLLKRRSSNLVDNPQRLW